VLDVAIIKTYLLYRLKTIDAKLMMFLQFRWKLVGEVSTDWKTVQ
jgi:hypothetical protein